MRRALAVAAAALVLLGLADLAATAVVERRAAAALCGDPEVALRPWPVSPRLLAGDTVAFAAEFDADDLMALVPLPTAVTGVAIRDGRLRLATVAGVEVPAEVELTADAIVVTPGLGPFDLDGLAITVPLAALPVGLSLTEVTIADGTVTAAGEVDPGALRDRGGPPSCPLSVS